jgi:hypothetical protein
MAETADEITAAYRDVVVLEEPPPWWTDEIDRGIARLTISEPDAALVLLAR